MKILELFSGYGTASFGLKRLGIDYELVGYSDIDKYANQCFQQNHGGKELGDVKNINPNDLEDFDLLTGGFPCQAFSVAGKMQGELDTRGTLFNEIIRIAEYKKPKYMLLENVKGLTCKKFKDTFNKILSELDRIGYDVYWDVLNTKDYGIPQSRARVWFVCFRKDLNRKEFKFPEKEELKIFIKDILEPQVDEKYYLSEKLQERFAKYLDEKNRKLSESEPAILDLYNKKVKDDGSCITLSDPCHNNLRLIEGTYQEIICAMRGRNPDNPKSRVSGLPTEQMIEFQEEPINNTLSTIQKDNLVYTNEIKSIQLDSSGKGYNSQNDRIYDSNGVMTSIPSNGASNKCNVFTSHRANEIREYSDESPTLKTTIGTGGNNVPMVAISNCSARECGFQSESSPTLCASDYKDPKIVSNVGKLRRLTPKECFRLQGFLNDEVNLDSLSDTQRYKLAGNGQSVNVVEKIFKEMFIKELEKE